MTCSNDVLAVLVVREMLRLEGEKMREKASEAAAEQKQKVYNMKTFYLVMCHIMSL